MHPHALYDGFRLEGSEFRYEPFPVGYCANIFPETKYSELLKNWPATSLFSFKPELGKKYSLSPLNHPDDYYRFITQTPCWHSFYDWIKSEDFIRYVAGCLEDRGIDLGLKEIRMANTEPRTPMQRRLEQTVRRFKRKFNISFGGAKLSTRFEFSMMPAAGGNIPPHTDSPGKLITLVLSMCAPGEWDSRWGGGTALLKPRDRSRSYNWLNRQMPFEECETVHTFPFEPNQCVLFVKTYNSLHAVNPMSGPAEKMRRTLTINIEQID